MMNISKHASCRFAAPFVAALVANFTQSAQADCALWDLPASTTFVHSNGINVNMSLHRQGQQLTGSGGWSEIMRGDGETVGRDRNGGLNGRIEGNQLNFEITWGHGPVGAYSGEIDAQGRLAGTTFDRTHPENRATWFSSTPAKCVAAEQRKPVKMLGKRRPVVSAQIPNAAVAPQSGALCVSGFVWREARPNDLVCVSPDSRGVVWTENSSAPQRWTPGAYGPNTCVSGFVWREAFDGDVVCVTPQRRDEVRQENGLAASRRVGG